MQKWVEPRFVYRFGLELRLGIGSLQLEKGVGVALDPQFVLLNEPKAAEEAGTDAANLS